MLSVNSDRPTREPPAEIAPVPVEPASRCLNCGADLVGAYCAECGQPAVDLAASTWRVVREALSDATDLDGRAFRTVRAIRSPGRLTVEFLCGRRVPYFGPLKLFLVVGALLSATWVLTRSVDARYYGLSYTEATSAYINTVVRGLMAASLAIAVSSWAFSRGRRRFLDEAVFALHVLSAVALWVALIVWLVTAWKVFWVTAARVPPGVPSLTDLAFVPAGIVALGYVAGAIRRVHDVSWWAAALRTFVFGAVGIAAVTIAVVAPHPF